MKCRRIVGLVFPAAMIVALAFGTASAQRQGTTTLFEDDFKDGFSASGPEANWSHFSAPGFVGDDGKSKTSSQGLRVTAPGTNPHTGEPASTKTLAQEDENGSGLPGG